MAKKRKRRPTPPTPEPSARRTKNKPRVPRIVAAVFVAGALYVSGLRVTWPLGAKAAHAVAPVTNRITAALGGGVDWLGGLRDTWTDDNGDDTTSNTEVPE